MVATEPHHTTNSTNPASACTNRDRSASQGTTRHYSPRSDHTHTLLYPLSHFIPSSLSCEQPKENAHNRRPARPCHMAKSGNPKIIPERTTLPTRQNPSNTNPNRDTNTPAAPVACKIGIGFFPRRAVVERSRKHTRQKDRKRVGSLKKKTAIEWTIILILKWPVQHIDRV